MRRITQTIPQTWPVAFVDGRLRSTTFFNPWILWGSWRSLSSMRGSWPLKNEWGNFATRRCDPFLGACAAFTRLCWIWTGIEIAVEVQALERRPDPFVADRYQIHKDTQRYKRPALNCTWGTLPVLLSITCLGGLGHLCLLHADFSEISRMILDFVKSEILWRLWKLA